jgi:hypothetical protein
LHRRAPAFDPDRRFQLSGPEAGRRRAFAILRVIIDPDPRAVAVVEPFAGCIELLEDVLDKAAVRAGGRDAVVGGLGTKLEAAIGIFCWKSLSSSLAPQMPPFQASQCRLARFSAPVSTGRAPVAPASTNGVAAVPDSLSSTTMGARKAYVPAASSMRVMRLFTRALSKTACKDRTSSTLTVSARAGWSRQYMANSPRGKLNE